MSTWNCTCCESEGAGKAVPPAISEAAIDVTSERFAAAVAEARMNHIPSRGHVPSGHFHDRRSFDIKVERAPSKDSAKDRRTPSSPSTSGFQVALGYLATEHSREVAALQDEVALLRQQLRRHQPGSASLLEQAVTHRSELDAGIPSLIALEDPAAPPNMDLFDPALLRSKAASSSSGVESIRDTQPHPGLTSVVSRLESLTEALQALVPNRGQDSWKKTEQAIAVPSEVQGSPAVQGAPDNDAKPEPKAVQCKSYQPGAEETRKLDNRDKSNTLVASRKSSGDKHSAEAAEQRMATNPFRQSLQIMRKDAETAEQVRLVRILSVMEWYMDLEEPLREGMFAQVILSQRFEVLCTFVITLNAMFVAVGANWDIQNLGQEPTVTMQVVELLFAIFFMFELIAKLFVHRWYFFANENMRWNVMDSFIVVMAIYDQILIWSKASSSGSNFTFMRSLRLMRMAKLLRVARVMRMFEDLRMMFSSLVGSLTSLFWCFVMLGFMLYMFALIFTQGFTNFLLENLGRVDSTDHEFILENFGGVQQSMMSLYKATTGGEDWRVYYGMVERTGTLYNLIFIFYIGFFQFALFNILTGLFVENALKHAKPNHDTLVFDQRRQQIAEGHAMQAFCHEIDADGTGTISLNEFVKALENEKVKTYLQLQGLDVKDAEMFFRMLLSASDSDEIDISAFVEGATKMKGMATAVDLQTLMFQMAAMRKQNKKVTQQIFDRLDSMTSRLH